MRRVDLPYDLPERAEINFLPQLHPQRLVLLILQLAHLVADLRYALHSLAV
jgi:hypothetical protein